VALAMALAKALEVNSSLQTLGYVVAGVGMRLVVLGNCAMLMRCDVAFSLGANLIGDGGCVALAKAMEVNSSLQTLEYVVAGVRVRLVVLGNCAMLMRGDVSCSLGDNHIGEGGGMALGEALEVNSSLQTLEYVIGGVRLRLVVLGNCAMLMRGDVSCSLSNNRIGEGGGVALAKALEVNSSLQTLAYVVAGVRVRLVVLGNCAMLMRGDVSCSLTYNNTGDGGGMALGKALVVNSSLQTLEYVVYVYF